jgi:hypothetical protein
MKIADIIGFSAILAGGAYGGYQYSEQGALNLWDWVVIFVLLAIGFYFAVILS